MVEEVSMMPALPTEILLQIVAHCDRDSWKQLALVSRRWSQASLSCLYHTVRYSAHTVSSLLCAPLDKATPIYDLRLFHRSIATSPELRSLVVQAYLTWDKVTDTQESAHSPSQQPSGSVDPVRDVANLLGRSETFKTLDLSLPRLDSPIPFLIPMVTSLRIMLSSRQLDRGPDYERLMRLFSIPTLWHVEIDYVSWWNFGVPSGIRQHGISNVTSLALTHSGPPGEDLGHVLSWMNDLRSLHIKVCIDDAHLRHYGTPAAGKVAWAGLLSVLDQQKEKLQDVFLRLDHKPDYRVTRKAFRDYTALKRLNVPLEFLMEPENEGCPSNSNVTPPIHEILPSTLEELVLQLESHFPFYTISDIGGETIKPTKELYQLFDWLSDIPEHRAQQWPQLRRVTMSKDPQGYGRFHGGDPLECEQYTAVRRSFDLSNVELCVI